MIDVPPTEEVLTIAKVAVKLTESQDRIASGLDGVDKLKSVIRDTLTGVADRHVRNALLMAAYDIEIDLRKALL